jgi:RNA polymerase sigma-B factor
MLIEWRAHDQWLLTRVKRDGDRRALEELVRRMLPLVHLLARKYKRGREPLEDLVQVASLGLMKAIAGFDPTRGQFLAYAVPTMTGELKRHFRDNGWMVHVDRGLQDRALRVKRLSEEATVQLGRPPHSDELAARLDLSVEQVREARLAANAYTALSLDATAEARSALPSLVQAEEDPRYLLVEDLALLGSALRILPPRERRILALHFGAELSQAEIGERLGISQMHVSRLLRRSLDRVTRVADKRLAPLREAA